MEIGREQLWKLLTVLVNPVSPSALMLSPQQQCNETNRKESLLCGYPYLCKFSFTEAVWVPMLLHSLVGQSSWAARWALWVGKGSLFTSVCSCLPACPSSSLSIAFLVIEIKTVLCHHTCICFQIWISKAHVQICFSCITALQGLHLHSPFQVYLCLDFSPCHQNYVLIHICQGGLKMYFPLSRPSMTKL